MRMELGGLLNELTIDGVLYFSLHGNGNGLGHFVAGNDTDPGLS
jgi:hypothetical protein